MLIYDKYYAYKVLTNYKLRIGIHKQGFLEWRNPLPLISDHIYFNIQQYLSYKASSAPEATSEGLNSIIPQGHTSHPQVSIILLTSNPIWNPHT